MWSVKPSWDQGSKLRMNFYFRTGLSPPLCRRQVVLATEGRGLRGRARLASNSGPQPCVASILARTRRRLVPSSWYLPFPCRRRRRSAQARPSCFLGYSRLCFDPLVRRRLFRRPAPWRAVRRGFRRAPRRASASLPSCLAPRCSLCRCSRAPACRAAPGWRSTWPGSTRCCCCSTGRRATRCGPGAEGPEPGSGTGGPDE